MYSSGKVLMGKNCLRENPFHVFICDVVIIRNILSVIAIYALSWKNSFERQKQIFSIIKADYYMCKKMSLVLKIKKIEFEDYRYLS